MTMREFWQPVLADVANHQLLTDDLLEKRTNDVIVSNRQLLTDDLSGSTTIANRPLPLGEIQIIQTTTDDQEEI
jgi:hypothetical protein